MAQKQITFRKNKISYDPDAIMSWAVQKKITAGGIEAFEAVDLILCGKSDEVAEQIGGGMADMTELITAIMALESAKN